MFRTIFHRQIIVKCAFDEACVSVIEEENGGIEQAPSWHLIFANGVAKSQHDWATSLGLFTFMHWRRKWHPTPVLLPGESQGREPGGLPSWGRTESDTTEATRQQQQQPRLILALPWTSRMTLGNFPVLIIGVLIHKWVLITFPHRITERISDRHTKYLAQDLAQSRCSLEGNHWCVANFRMRVPAFGIDFVKGWDEHRGKHLWVVFF